jgi:hypothetical protein
MADTNDDGGLARNKTLRDEFAGLAVFGLLASQDETNGYYTHDIDVVGPAYDIADAMIAEKRRREGGKNK